MTDHELEKALVIYFVPQDARIFGSRDKATLRENILAALEVRGWQFEAGGWEYFVGRDGEIQCGLPVEVS